MNKLYDRLVIFCCLFLGILYCVGFASPTYESLRNATRDQITVRNYGGQSSDTITQVIASVSGKYVSFIFDGGEWEITENVTFPANIDVYKVRGTYFDVHTGCTVTYDTVYTDGINWTSEYKAGRIYASQEFTIGTNTASGIMGAYSTSNDNDIVLFSAMNQMLEDVMIGTNMSNPMVRDLAMAGHAITDVSYIVTSDSKVIISNGNVNAARVLFTADNSSMTSATDFDYISLGGTTNIVTDDGTNLTRNGEMVGNVKTYDDPVDRAFLMYNEASNGYGHVYTIRLTWNTADFLAAQAASNTIYIGQLYRFSFNNKVYECTNAITAPPFASTNYPTPLDSEYWRVFVEDGEDGSDGATGAQGIPGLDGIGNIVFGPWVSLDSYVYDTSALPVVSRSGRWYECVASSTNKDPAGVVGTNYWSLSVDKGSDGTITVVSNLIDRGVWNSGDQYTNFDAVTYSGNSFYVGETNLVPVIGAAPPVAANIGYNNAYWICYAAKGDKGNTGATGEDGAITTNILFITYNVLFDTNVYEWTNDADTTNRVPVFGSTAGGTNYYTWVADTDIAVSGVTNIGDGLSGDGQATPLSVNLATATNAPAAWTNQDAETDPIWIAAYAGGLNLTSMTNAPAAWTNQDAETDPIWIAAYAAGLNLSSMTNFPAAWTNQSGGSTNAAYGSATSYDAATGTITIDTNSVIGGLWAAVTNIEATSVTGAVTSISGVDGVITIDGATNSGQTIYLPSNDPTNAVAKTGDTMTGPLTISATNTLAIYCPSPTNVVIGDWDLSDVHNNLGWNTLIGTGTNGCFWSTLIGQDVRAIRDGNYYYYNTVIGAKAAATGDSCTVVGHSASGKRQTTAIGDLAQGGLFAVAVGAGAKAGQYSAIVGAYAAGGGKTQTAGLGYNLTLDSYSAIVGEGSDSVGNYGAGIGYRNKSGLYGFSGGAYAEAGAHGISVGADAKGSDYQVAIGAASRAYSTNISIGAWANSGTGGCRVAIGCGVTNWTDNSTSVRGDMYLDGATSLWMRGVSGGNWVDIDAGIGYTNYNYMTSSWHRVIWTDGPIFTNDVPELTNNVYIGGTLYLDGATGVMARASAGSGDYYPVYVPQITNVHPGTTATLKSDDGVTSYWLAD